MSSKDVTEALRNLMQQNDANVVPAPKPRGEAGAVKSAAPPPGASNKGSGGLASPLVETSYAARTWHAETTINSTDGLFTLKLKHVKEVKFLDLAGAAVTIEFKAPA